MKTLLWLVFLALTLVGCGTQVVTVEVTSTPDAPATLLADAAAKATALVESAELQATLVGLTETPEAVQAEKLERTGTALARTLTPQSSRTSTPTRTPTPSSTPVPDTPSVTPILPSGSPTATAAQGLVVVMDHDMSPGLYGPQCIDQARPKLPAGTKFVGHASSDKQGSFGSRVDLFVEKDQLLHRPGELLISAVRSLGTPVQIDVVEDDADLRAAALGVLGVAFPKASIRGFANCDEFLEGLGGAK